MAVAENARQSSSGQLGGRIDQGATRMEHWKDALHWIRQDFAVAPLILTSIPAIYRAGRDWALTTEEYQELSTMADFFQAKAGQDSSYALHADFFSHARNLETRHASFPQRLAAMYAFFSRWGFFTNDGNVRDVTGFGKEAMDERDATIVDMAHTDYWKVKRALAAPSVTELLAFIFRAKRQPEGLDQRDSLLLKGYTKVISALANYRNENLPTTTICEIGPGKCDSVVRLCAAEHRRGQYKGRKMHVVTVVDIQPQEFVTQSLQDAWKRLGRKEELAVIPLGLDSEENNRQIREAKRNSAKVIFIIADHDASSAQLPLPDGSQDSVGNIFVVHHAEQDQKGEQQLSPQGFMIAEMARIARVIEHKNKVGQEERAVFIVDALRNAKAIRQVLIPVATFIRAYKTFLDAVITYVRGWGPHDAKDLGRTANPNIYWNSDLFGPTIAAGKKTIISPLLAYLAGFNPERIKVKKIGNAL